MTGFIQVIDVLNILPVSPSGGSVCSSKVDLFLLSKAAEQQSFTTRQQSSKG